MATTRSYGHVTVKRLVQDAEGLTGVNRETQPLLYMASWPTPHKANALFFEPHSDKCDGEIGEARVVNEQ